MVMRWLIGQEAENSSNLFWTRLRDLLLWSVSHRTESWSHQKRFIMPIVCQLHRGLSDASSMPEKWAVTARYGHCSIFFDDEQLLPEIQSNSFYRKRNRESAWWFSFPSPLCMYKQLMGTDLALFGILFHDASRVRVHYISYTYPLTQIIMTAH